MSKFGLEIYLGNIQEEEVLGFAIDSPHKVKKKKTDLLEEGQEKKKLCIDFDGTIHAYSKGYHDGTIYDVPINGAKEAIDILKETYEIVIFSARFSKFVSYDFEDQKRKVAEWLKKYDIYYDLLTAEKLAAVAYIDDRAISFKDNWKDMVELVKKVGEDAL